MINGLCGHAVEPKTYDFMDTLEQTLLDLQSTNFFLVKEVNSLKLSLNCLSHRLEIVNQRLDIVAWK
jgi:hypothetical protein